MKSCHDTLDAKGSTDRQSITHLPKKAPGAWSRAYFVLVLGAAMLCLVATAAQRSELDGHQAVQPDSSNSVDPPVCATCHKEVVAGVADDPHSKRTPIDSGKAVTCESCHGPGKAHARDGNTNLIFDPATATAEAVSEKCKACHGGTHADFERSAHGRANLSCIACHTIHPPSATKHLLKMEQPQLCFRCHNDVKPQFSMLLHHKVEEKLIECTDCHPAHDTLERNARHSSARQFIMCTKCHTPVAGPFVYMHAVIEAEGCTSCHFSHGGPNRKLLIETDLNKICLQCHLPPSTPGVGLPAVPEHIQSAQSPTCISCHSSIHGSNTSDVFLKPTSERSEH